MDDCLPDFCMTHLVFGPPLHLIMNPSYAYKIIQNALFPLIGMGAALHSNP